ncbi:YezD family protein [Paenibacillus sp. EZ-K15]|uniref:YezD family protein n=1 Tax=Paenibacillus sp. EZ-K15 TaxID=2044275 RepID=UPI000BF3D349|nr:YezD family protein [Paenibacillus sp. EZ-K15]
MAKPLKVDEMWLERIASLLNDMEFGSLQIVVHEGQIVQMERTERKRFENTPSGAVKTSGPSRASGQQRRTNAR